MATQRLIRNLTNTATGGTVAADDYLALSGATNDGRKILVSEVANYVATEEGGSTLASLTAGKVPASQLPSGFDAGTYLGLWDANANSPALSNGSGTQGDYYIVGTAGTTSIDGISSWAVGDEIRANASAWEKLTPGTTAVTQGGTGATTAEGARTNLEVDSKDEIAEGLTRGEPSLYLNGSNEWISVPHNSGLAFGDASGNVDLPFSGSIWLAADTWTPSGTEVLAEKSSGTAGWWLIITSSGILEFHVRSTSNQIKVGSTASLSTKLTDGNYANITWSLDGAGTGYSNTLQNTLDSFVIYVNGESFALGAATAVIGTKAGYESDGGRGDDGGSLNWGGFNGSNYLAGEIRNVQLFNSALTAAQVEQIYRSGVPYELSQAQAGDSVTDGGFENWDSATDLTSWSEGSSGTSTVNRESTVVDSGTYAVRFDLDSSSNYAAVSQSGILTVGKLYNVTVRARGDGSSVGLQIGNTSDGAAYGNTGLVFTSSYATYSFTITATEETFAIGRQAGSAASSSIYVDNISIREAGAILDLNSADASGTNLPDRSGNFSATLNNMSVAANAVNLPAALSANHPNPSSGEALCSLSNNGTEMFKVDEGGEITTGNFGVTNSQHTILTKQFQLTASGGTLVLQDLVSASGTGILIISEDVGNGSAIFATRGSAGDPVLFGTSIGSWSVTKGNSSSHNVYRDGANSNKLTIENQQGSTSNVTILFIGT